MDVKDLDEIFQNQPETMNIYAKRGDKVKFSFPDWGYNSDIEKAKEYLTVGKEYTIEKTDVSSWHTNVYLQEFPEVSFNSIMFEDVVEGVQNESIS
jgi:hypothetical protein